VNPGGEPERDDTGLPPVDIEIPDDARELERDVQAYRRELRAWRRNQRQGRWRRSLSKDGVALPLLACCLVLALITGTLLTVFTATANPILTGPRSPAASAPAQTGAPAPRVVAIRALPSTVITVDRTGPVRVSTLKQAMLVLVPSGCRSCAGTLEWLDEVAANTYAQLYVIYAPSTETEARQLGRQVPGPVFFAEDTGSGLSTAKVKAGIPAQELAAILIAPDGAATWASNLNARDDQTPMIRALVG
jgi:hypothetical protein